MRMGNLNMISVGDTPSRRNLKNQV